MSFISDLFNGLIKDPLEQINNLIDKVNKDSDIH